MKLESGILEFRWGGAKLALRPATMDLLVFKEVFVEDQYRLSDSPALETVVDLGGQIGMFACRVSQYAKRVVSVEAFPGNVALLQRNTERGGKPGVIHVVNKAVGRRSGETLALYSHPGNTGGHSVNSELVRQDVQSKAITGEAPQAVSVESVSLNDLFESEGITRCSLLKCDIEGGEYDVFEGASDETLLKVDRFVMELHELAGSDGAKARSVEDRLKSLGYTVDTTVPRKGKGDRPWNFMLYATRTQV